MRQEAALDGERENTASTVAPTPPVDRRLHGATTEFIAFWIAAVVIVLGLVVLRALFPEVQVVQTSARIGCALPSEHETRLLFVNTSADGAIQVECGPMVGGRGAYPGARR